MDTKPPTRTFPKLVMKEWPTRDDLLKLAIDIEADLISAGMHTMNLSDKALSDFTRVLEGVEGQKRPQKEKSRDE